MTTTLLPTAPESRRRWLQFSLRTLLLLTLAFACGFGWLVFKIKRAREQREAVEAIEELGGIVDCEPAWTRDASLRSA